MNAVEVEEALTILFEGGFDAETFPSEFLRAFGNKDATIKRLMEAPERRGSTNKSTLPNGILQRKNIHFVVVERGELPEALEALRQAPETKRHAARFVLATDGVTLEAEDLLVGDYITCEYGDFPGHFVSFLPLAGIEIVATNSINQGCSVARFWSSIFDAGFQIHSSAEL